MREHVCWYWEQGWPFLLIDQRVRVVTTGDAAARTAGRGIGRALVYPVRTIWRNRGLIRVMTRRDVLGRYRGSFGGSFWTVFNPLLLMLTYYFVFAVVLGRAFRGIRAAPGSPCITWRGCCRGWRSAKR